jgi:hypothetical protein
MIENLGSIVVSVDVEEDVWEPVANYELSQPSGVRRGTEADDSHSGTRLDQQLPAPEGGLHDDIGECLVLVKSRPQAIKGDREDVTGLGDHRGGENALTGEKTEFCGKLSRATRNQFPLYAGLMIYHCDRA